MDTPRIREISREAILDSLSLFLQKKVKKKSEVTLVKTAPKFSVRDVEKTGGRIVLGDNTVVLQQTRVHSRTGHEGPEE